MILLFSSFEKVNVKLKVPGKKLEHHGIKIEFVGQIGMQGLCVMLFRYTDATLRDFLIEATCSVHVQWPFVVVGSFGESPGSF